MFHFICRQTSGGIADLAVQLDVFAEQRDSDEARGPEGINLNSHLDVFYALLRRVSDTPQEATFLSLLQHLLRAEPSDPLGALAWDAAETLVHRATLLDNPEDAARLLRTPTQVMKILYYLY